MQTDVAAARHLPPTDQAALPEAISLDEADGDQPFLAMPALAEAGTIPALRALSRMVAHLTSPASIVARVFVPAVTPSPSRT